MAKFVLLVLEKSICRDDLIANADVVVNIEDNQPVPVKNRNGNLSDAIGEIIERLSANATA